MAKDRHYTRDDLDAMTKDELVALAEKEGLTVARGDGSEGDPLKSDYVDALAAETDNGPAIVTSKSRERGADETIPGGRYVDAQGNWVNAHGKHIDASGNEVEKPVKAPAR
jgi:hypothetical protein